MLIVAHDTEGVDSRSTLKHGDGRSVSIHRLIQKFPRANGTTDILPGRPERQLSGVVIYDMVPDDRGANHAGYATWKDFTPTGRNVNMISLGFELECLGSRNKNDHYTEDQLLAAGFVINQWRAKYGPLPLVRHADIDPKRRSDTYNLSVAELEKWANAAALVYQIDAPTKRYRVKRVMISQRQEGGPPYAGELAPGDEVVADKWYSNNKVHLQDGRGFVDLADLEAV